jgi:RimJ/RimL family protein N-acetyltransferase
VAGFEKFIHWAHRQRAAGRYACFAVVPDGQSTAVGMFQISVPDSNRQVAEWGFALGQAYWGSGIFLAGAKHVVDFAFGQMGLRRLEARSAVQNGRGNGALNKLGAVLETVLRGSFERNGEKLDQALWSIAAENWWAGAPVKGATIH